MHHPASFPSSAFSGGVLSDDAGLACWRPRVHDAPSLARIRDEQEREEQLYRHALARAQNADTPLADLFELALALRGAEEAERSAQARRLAEEALAWRDAFDGEGNPLWITLAPHEEREEQTEPQTILPGPAESAAPKGTLRLGNSPDAEKREIPARDNPLFDALDKTVRYITGTPRQEPALPKDPYQGRGTLPPPKPRVLSGLLRMLAIGACLAVIYHVLSLKGWAPRLF